MTNIAKRASILMLIIVLAGLLQPWTMQNRTVPYQESSLFYSRAQAAPAWLPWLSEQVSDLDFGEFYSGASPLGLEMSPKLQSLAGKKVRISGFMAPPLKPTLSFFVLTKVPMSICPFCSTDADWPNDIVLIKLQQPVTALPFDRPITVTGQLELGYQLDNETGFVSLVRIMADTLAETN